jgi:hypothetical protein
VFDGGGDEAYIGLYEEDGLMAVVLVNPEDVAGFQFNVSGIELLSAFGGAAEEAGFMISSNASGTVIGFSLQGTTIPASEDGQILVVLDYLSVDEEACLNDVILSDASGNAIDTVVGECIDIGGDDDGGDDGGEECDAQVCLSLDGGDLNYVSTEGIAGFQFNHNGCVTGASGGDAEAAGFMIQFSGSIVLAFSIIVPSPAGTTSPVIEKASTIDPLN